MAPPLGALDPSDRRRVERRIDQHLLRIRLVSLALLSSLALVTGGALWAVVSGFLAAPLAGLPEAATWAVGLYVAAALITAHLVTGKLLGRIPESHGHGAERIMKNHFGAVLVGMAVRESAGILGAIWGALIGSLPWVLILAVPPLLTMVAAWPRRRDVVRRFQ